MCGIAGIVNLRGNAVEPAEISRLTNLVAHRGPFGEGSWFSANRNLAFGHRRLAIIDPGDGGYQPMVSGDGRHVIVFNGEIYNFLELRRELEAQGAVFRSQSDTEVILAAWQAWQEGMLTRFNGMWALAIFDTQTEELFLARDRFGIKPLLYALTSERFVFASEQRALVRSGLINVSLDIDVARRLHARCLRGRGKRADPLPGGAPPAGRSLHVVAPGKVGNPALVADGGSSAGDPGHRSRTRRALSRAFPGCRRASDAQRRADRDLPVGRVRFVGRDLHHGGARKGRHGSAGQHLLASRLRRDVPRRLQRRASDGRGGRGLGGCCADIPRDRPRRCVDRARSNSR